MVNVVPQHAEDGVQYRGIGLQGNRLGSHDAVQGSFRRQGGGHHPGAKVPVGNDARHALQFRLLWIRLGNQQRRDALLGHHGSGAVNARLGIQHDRWPADQLLHPHLDQLTGPALGLYR